jgi:hypothetical protein
MNPPPRSPLPLSHAKDGYSGLNGKKIAKGVQFCVGLSMLPPIKLGYGTG